MATNTLKKNIKNFINNLSPLSDYEQSIREEVLARLKQDKLIRAENSETHFNVFFWPVNIETKKVFLGHHIKSNKWIPPGGHTEPSDKSLIQAVLREIGEELGVEASTENLLPFMFSYLDLNNPSQPCQRHYDLWFLFKTDKTLIGTKEEFFQTKWVTFYEAQKLVTDPQVLIALEKLQKI